MVVVVGFGEKVLEVQIRRLLTYAHSYTRKR
jgi:hypothetical protein